MFSNTYFFPEQQFLNLRSKGTIKQFKKDEIIDPNSFEDQYLCIVIEGNVETQLFTNEGKSMLLNEYMKSDMFGYLYNDNILQYRLRFLEDTTLSVLAKEQFDGLVRSDITILENFIKWREIMYLTQLVRSHDWKINGKHGLIASILLRLASTCGVQTENGIQIMKKVETEYLARKAGTARENISRILKEFVNRGLITFKKKSITILAVDELRKINQCLNCSSHICRI